MSGVLASLGLRRVLNAAGTLSRLGGSPLAPEVVAAMAEVAPLAIDMQALQERASAEIAHATGAEAGMVTTGAAAGLALAAAAVLAGLEPGRMMTLPFLDDGRAEILIHRAHRSTYARMLAVGGARMVDFGHLDRALGAGVRRVEGWEIEAAIGPRTAALFFTATAATLRDLPLFAERARRHGLPLIVDAAAQLPPKANLRRFVAEGADLVVFSGGKAIGGPQSSGILAGRRDLIASALMQSLDLDVPPAAWRPPLGVAIAAPPHHGLGRGFKAGKEEIVGLIVALRRFLAHDEVAANDALCSRLETIAAALPLRATLLPAERTGRRPLLHLHCQDAAGLAAALRKGDPAVHVREADGVEPGLILDVSALNPEDDAVLIEAIRAALR